MCTFVLLIFYCNFPNIYLGTTPYIYNIVDLIPICEDNCTLFIALLLVDNLVDKYVDNMCISKRW